jgi:hypothetical protein
MAVRIPIYQQQSGTPGVRLTGGQLTTDVGGNVGGALVDLARGLGVMGQRIDDEKEGVASAWAGDELAKFQAEYPRQADALKRESGEAGEGYVEKINGWRQQRQEEILAAAPTEKSRQYLRTRMQEFGTRIDLDAYGYQQEAQNGWVLSKVDAGTESAAAAAAANPGFAPIAIAESRAAIEANPVLRPDQKREKIDALIQTVSYADVLGELERDPYKARTLLRARIGIGEAAAQGEAMQAMESAAAALEKTEAEEGFKVPEDQRQEVIANLMVGGTIGMKDGEMVVNRPGGETAQVPLTFGALAVPKVIELLSRADAEIARRENELEQRAMAGKITFAQKWQDTNTALQNGDPVPLPPRSEAALFYKTEELDIMYRQAETMQVMAGELKAMEGRPNADLAAVLAEPQPVGAANREATQAAWMARKQRAAQVMAARDADPGAYVLSTSPSVQSASEIYTDAAERAAAGDEAAVQEMPAALRDYISVSLGEQARLGIAKPALPKQFVSGIVDQFNSTIRENPQSAAANLQFLATMLDGMPETRNKIAQEVGVIGQFAMEGVAPQVVKRLYEASQVKEAQMKELLPTGVTWNQVVEGVNDAFAPLTLALGTNVIDRDRYVQSAQTLAANYLATGKYKSPKEAASAAYNELFADYNQVADTGSYYIPKNGSYDPAAVQAGLMQYVAELSGTDLLVEPSGRPLEEARMAKARTVRNQAFWLNNADDTGVILNAPGGITVKDENGRPIEVKFSDAQLIRPQTSATQIPYYQGVK